ncbi:MAG: tRNA pseudouridine(55) synthase TruB [Termitinemataceae bacterium]|nr:MAG: tRNA pseudouridine(55) synthase TruB [Termitinemataceae bacterium]
MNELSYLLLNKPSGITSFDALRPIKKLLQTGKVGHCGTLDKFATGLLILLTGKSLKLSNYFMNCAKHYEGTICFGKQTDTLDPEGATVKKAALPSLCDIEAALPSFVGSIMQTPPEYSALHINGKRASDIARSGQSPAVKPRNITIYDLSLLDWSPPFAKISVHCSSGTYIRSLARDIGAKSGSCAYLCELKRNSIGGFSRDDAFNLADLQDTNAAKAALCPVSPETFAKIGIACIEIDEKTAASMKHGAPLSKLPLKIIATKPTMAVFCGGNLAALIEHSENHNGGKKSGWKYGFVV